MICEDMDYIYELQKSITKNQRNKVGMEDKAITHTWVVGKKV